MQQMSHSVVGHVDGTVRPESSWWLSSQPIWKICDRRIGVKIPKIFELPIAVMKVWVEIMAGQPIPPGHVHPLWNKGLIAGLIKENQWLIGPDHKAGYFGGLPQAG